MRAGINNVDVITEGDGDLFVGFCLGSDFCSEHECEISALKRSLHTNEKELGIARDVAHDVKPEDVIFVKTTKHALLIVDDSFSCLRLRELITSKTLEKLITKRQYPFDYDGLGTFPNEKEKISGAWCERNFGILVREKHIANLESIYNALMKDDLSVSVGGQHVFDNGGLMLMIFSRISQKAKDSCIQHDKEAREFQTYAKSTGIEDRLKAAKKKYFACSPRSLSKEEADKRGTKYSAIFWLNPEEQHRNNYGWFTVEELDQWIQNTGPIPMKECCSKTR